MIHIWWKIWIMMTSLLCFLYKTLQYICDNLKTTKQEITHRIEPGMWWTNSISFCFWNLLEVCVYSLWIYRDTQNSELRTPQAGLDFSIRILFHDAWKRTTDWNVWLFSNPSNFHSAVFQGIRFTTGPKSLGDFFRFHEVSCVKIYSVLFEGFAVEISKSVCLTSTLWFRIWT